MKERNAPQRERLMRNIVLLFSVVALLCFCTQTRAENGRPPLKIGMDIPYPPFAMYDESGALVGFDVEIAEAVCRVIGRTCEIIPLPFEALIPAMESGKIDLSVAGMVPTPERKRVVDFTDRYFRSLSVYIQWGHTLHALKPEIIRGRTVAIQSGTLQGDYLMKQYGDEITILSTPAFEDVFVLMKEGKADLALVDGLPAYTFLKTEAGSEFEAVGEPISLGGDDDLACIAVSKKLPALRNAINKALLTIRRTGEYAKINRKYFDFNVY